MERWIDLHTHTTASDGSMSPRELVRHAKENGLTAIAITDHDTIAGLPDALDEAEKLGIEVITGLEIGVEFKPEMHILGYFLNNNYENINKTLIKLRESREERNPKIIHTLNQMGMEITLQEVEAEALGNVVGRPHIAKVLIKKGYVKSMEDAFSRYLASGRPAYFKKDKLSPEEGIWEIRNAGGIPVLAHPIFLNFNHSELDQLVGALAKAGLGGIEAYYSENSKDETGNLLRIAIKHQLLVTGGSDFHGSIKPNIALGKGRGNLEISYDLLDKMRTSLKELG